MVVGGERGTWSGVGWGKRTEAPWASRKNVNRQPQEIGVWGDPQNTPETLEVRVLPGLKARDLRWNACPLGEGTYRAHLQQKDRASNEGEGSHPTVTTLTHNCSCLKELQGWKWKGAWGKEDPATDPKWDPAEECIFKERISLLTYVFLLSSLSFKLYILYRTLHREEK